MAEIVGAVASVLGLAVELGKCIVQPIKRQFNYLCCFNNNIQSLRKEAERLDNARNGLQLEIEAAENKVEVIRLEVVCWLNSSNVIKDNIDGIETQIPIVKRHFWNIKSRFSLSRKAKKTTEIMKELRGDCKFNPISHPAPAPARGPIRIGETYEFETRKQIEEDIMEALKGGEVNMLGICGMGGVGKTTTAKRIMKRARDEKLFDEILMVVVSQPIDMSKIQREIFELLGLELKEKSLQARAHKLRVKLIGTKRALVVLDDVWEILKLEELGIPCESGVKGCTILLTSRNRDVFTAMDVQKVCALQILLEEEAWFLFREKVGSCVDDQDLVSIAREVVRECKGLPMALVIVGTALKNVKRKYIWENALRQLKSSDATHVLAEVYKPLKLSFDLLGNPHAKDVFLLCSLFPEDANISLKRLTWYLLGLGMFEGIRNLKETRNEVYTLVELLKSRFLLLDGYDKHHVKMHDVVRDVAIFIASKEEKLVDSNFSSIDRWLKHSYSDCTWISMFPQERIELPIVLNVPRLRLLLIHYSQNSKIQMHDQFFEAIKELEVLSLKYLSFRSFPQTMELMKNLLTLNLESCIDLESISIVGELSSLEILRCHYCTSITELPAEIGRLIHLRLLDFSYCESLKRVVPGVISSLFQLEELKMIGSFKGWESEKDGKERKNASLNELQSLSNLTCLEIEIADCALAAEDIHLSSEIVKCNIRLMDHYDNEDHYYNEAFEKRVWLELPREISLGDWILILLRRTEVLELKGDGSVKLDLAQVQEIKKFGFRECSTVKKLVSTTSIDWSFGVFPVLESLKLEELPNLEEICDGPIEAGSNSFNNLKELQIFYLPALMYLWNCQSQNVSLNNLTTIYIKGCDKLRNLFPLKMAKDGLLQLKKLQIRGCSMMEEVFSSNDGEEGHITFPKLEYVLLQELPSLTTLCKGVESIECPVLEVMYIDGCSKFTSFVSSTWNSSCFAGHYDDSSHFFCNQRVTFGNLQVLRISGNKNIRSLFTSSIATDLVNLKHLRICGCNEIVNVIGDHEENVCENSPCFPSLVRLSLESLPNLVNFCGWRCALELPSLREISIQYCHRMESFTMGSLTTPKLESINIGKCEKLHNLSLVGFATSSGNNLSVAGHSDDSFHLFCHQKVTFGRLKKVNIFAGYEQVSNLWCHQIPSAGFFSKLETLRICHFGSIRSLLSSSIAADLVNLKSLCIKSCNEMVKVIGDDEENVCENSQLMFPSLKWLSLLRLPNLVNFCGWRCALELPSLRDIQIEDCYRMESFTMGSLSTPNLKDIKIDDFKNEDIEDLNGVVQLWFREKVKSLDFNLLSLFLFSLQGFKVAIRNFNNTFSRIENFEQNP
ncbi:hypothetical protein BUALT_Bualt12G0032900 [Buddleja alternifolia]|uniref:AAA+ ATPase domain-containing protein n=1 Tax=Buddleja alternifolia TaxID=168488 RepID=A0AAV6WYR2_9LAMI|nr:hypothetical protein BUALT_Bualt12G0032900 [Buddleja alternifolia]